MHSESFEFRLGRRVRKSLDHLLHRDFKMLAKLVLFAVCGILLWSFNFSTVFILASCFAVHLMTGGWRFMRIVILTIPRDLRALHNLVAVKIRCKQFIWKNKTMDQVFDETVAKHPNKICFMFKDTKWQFVEFQAYVNKTANFLYNQGYRKGDVIAIYSENCPEMVAMWIAMARIGVTAALINFNLRDVALTHCIKVSGAKAIIFGSNLQDAIKEIGPNLPQGITYLSLGQDPVEKLPSINIEENLKQSSSLPPPRNRDIGPLDVLFYIYTSGTTGLPKAAKISHLRYYFMATGIKLFTRLKPDDILYTSLPFYHTAGAVLGIGHCLIFGIPIAVRQKFSASQFWSDCIKYKATAVQYIGEICRYLIAQPPKPEDKQHTVKLAYGNGLKPQIWKQFQDRFGVKDIIEFYGATEGNCSIVNNMNVAGAIGFCTRIFPFLYPVTVVKTDPETEQYVRDSRGMCVICEPGEPGEIVGKIIKKDPVRQFEGYVNEQATQKKVIHDVFKKGDQAFSSGDIVVMDELGYVFFCDRTGDTFRWRGENVSTSEVEAIISNHIQYSDAVVYGVEVPGCEGRAGMVAIVDPDNEIDLVSLGQQWCKALPSYARPLFVRILPQVDTTGTFKLKKNKLRDEGFNLADIKDPLYFLDPASRTYTRLTSDLYNDIVSRSLRL